MNTTLNEGVGRFDWVAIWRASNDYDRCPRRTVACQGLLVLAVFLVTQALFLACQSLPEIVYQRAVIFANALSYPLPLTLGLGSLLLLVFGWQRFSWQTFEHAAHARILAMALAATLAFAFGFCEFNYYFNQWHLLDRVLLIALAALIWLHPGFIGLFLLEAVAFTGQLNHPLGLSWTDKMLVYQLLALIQTFAWLKIVNCKMRDAALWFAVLVVVGAFYLKPGIGKILLNWLAHNEQGNIFLAAWYQNGWLNWISPRGIHAWLSLLGPTIMIITLVLEIVVCWYLVRPGLCVAVLLGLVAMHLGILATSGIFFWKWIVADLTIIGAVLTLPESTRQKVFNPAVAMIAGATMVVLCLTPLPAPKLAWYDAPMSNHYHVEAVGESGRVYQMPASVMAPYDLPFAQARFFFLSDSAPLVDCLGSTTDLAKLQEMSRPRALTNLPQIRKKYAVSQFDERRARAFQRVVWRCVEHLREERQNGKSVSWAPPQHIWTFPQAGIAQDVYEGQEPVAFVRVRQMEAFHQDGDLVEVNDQVVAKFGRAVPQVANEPATLRR